MNIDPEILTRCADAGIFASTSADSGIHRREAFARAVIETYVAASSPGDLMHYIDTHPDIREGEVFADATLRLLRERDDLKARVAKLEWRPVSVRPTAADSDGEGYLAATDGNEIRMILACEPPLWPPHGMTHWMPFVPPVAPSPVTFDDWWQSASEEERRVAAQRDWESTRACKGGDL